MAKKQESQEEAGNYEVGYAKPPKHTRFQPGRSGNPRGRPKGTNNLKTDLMEELGERILVREGEQARHVSKQRAMVKSLMASSLKGNTRAASLLLSMMMRLLDIDEAGADTTEPLLEDELEILRTFEARLRQDGAPARGSTEGGAGARERS